MESVVGVDVGAGNTSVFAALGNRIFKRLTFPSGVGLERHGALSEFRDKRESNFELRPKIGGTTFLVSIKPNQQVPDHGRAIRSDDYQAGDHHRALLAAALHSTGLSHIDILVTGAPVHTYGKHSKRLKECVGTLDFGFERPIKVGKTLVVPQPYGSLVAGINEGILEREEHVNHCVIDVGYFSTDTLKTKCLEIDYKRSFGSGFGTAAVYQLIANLLTRDLRMPVTDLDRIEYSLRTDIQYLAHGRRFDLKRDGYLEAIQPHIEAEIAEIYARLGTTEDIGSILLTGGGCALFENAVRKIFPSTHIKVMPDPVHANVRGYLLAGQSSL